MFKAITNLVGRMKGDGFRPSRSDKDLMENVRARLSMLGGLVQPVGTHIRSIPDATVKFLPMAGTSVPMVYDSSGKPVGSIAPDGKIVYVHHREQSE